MSKLYMVFDVESVGLHGEGFAVGFVVVDEAGEEHASGLYACPAGYAKGPIEGRAWIAQNIQAIEVTHDSIHNLRATFWAVWLRYQAQGAVLVADCAWPVEARFLVACVDDDPNRRDWQGPYPLHDVATMRLAAGLDPLATVERLPSELPRHNPLADARQSARLWLEALGKIGGRYG